MQPQRVAWTWLRLLSLALGATGPLNAGEPAPLLLLGDEQPRAFFFRQAEGLAAAQRMPYAQWERSFGRLMGVMGKVLDEEVPGRSRGLETFVRFKREHPTQAVLLHLNGNSRDPRFEGGRFFAGHWLYHNGATVLDPLPAEPGEATVRVSDATLFETGIGRYRNANDDIGLCELGADGRPDWSRAEQVQLLAVDRRARTIRVRRGAHGTAPRAFAASRTYAAAHCAEGPWGRDSNLLWNYNYATTAPRDAAGRTCAEIFVSHLAELFGPGGPLAPLDGLEFDVLFHVPNGSARPRRGPDCDADGRRDGGVVDGVNVYGNGVTEFCRRLRAALGDNRLILADGAFRLDNEQRATGSLNGIESEGWPVLGDFAIDDWSGGLNRHEFWRTRGRAPALSYANIKFVEHDEKPGETRQASVPLGRVRLAFAGAVFTDSAITFAHRPESPAGGIGIWDELVAGTEQRVGWLGRGGAARHLAEETPDLLGIASPSAPGAWTSRVVTATAEVVADGTGVRLTSRPGTVGELVVQLENLPVRGPDLCVTLEARAAPMKGAPPETARLVHARLEPAAGEDPNAREVMSWVGRESFVSRFYFRGVTGDRVTLRLRFEAVEPVWITALRAHAAPDRMLREFARGLVIANPSDQPQAFDLATLVPGRIWRRLRGTKGQDETTNSGAPVGAVVLLPARDALFLQAGSDQ